MQVSSAVTMIWDLYKILPDSGATFHLDGFIAVERSTTRLVVDYVSTYMDQLALIVSYAVVVDSKLPE